jgi:hypothetical protein
MQLNMRKNFLLAAAFALVSSLSFAQQVQITGVRKNEFRGVKEIENKGYYTFYVNEKAGKGMVEFMLEIYDQDLNIIKKTPILITKSSIMIDGEFNGKDFLFAFADYSKKENTFATIDINGNIVKQEVRKNKKSATAGTTAVYPSMDGDGFFITQAVKEKKWGYSIEKVDRNMSQLWEKTVTNEKGFVGIEAAEANNGKLVLVTAERPSALSNKVFGKIVCFNGTSGKLNFEQPLYDGARTGIPSSFLIDKAGNVITAGMYFDGEKWDNTDSDGIFFMKLSPEGKKVAYSTTDWDNGIQKLLKSTSRKFSIGSKPKVLFHEIVESNTGDYQVISETFRKTVKAGTVLAAMASSGGTNRQPAPMGFTVMDYIIFNYGQNGEVKDINKIEKPYKSDYVDGRIAQMGGVSLAYYMKKQKMFTYEFMTLLPESNLPVIVYTNYDDAGISKGKPYVGITSIQSGKESKTTKIAMSKKIGLKNLSNTGVPFAISSDPGDGKSGAIRSKPGYVCMYYYDKKTKTINMALEELKM